MNIGSGKITYCFLCIALVISLLVVSSAAVQLSDKEVKLIMPPSREPLETPVMDEIHFEQTELWEVVKTFARAGNLNFYLDKDVTNEKITVYAGQSTILDVLNNILMTSGLAMKRTGERDFLIFPKKKEADYADRACLVYPLRNVTPEDAIKALKYVSKNIQMAPDANSSSVIVFDYPENLVVARDILDSIDVVPPQVLVDLQLLEVNKNKMKELGIELTENTFTLARLKDITDQNAPAVLKLLKSDGITHVLAHPSVRVLEKEKAEILIGDRIPIEISTTSQTDQGDLKLDTQIDWKDVGIKLAVEAINISIPDVTMELESEVSSIIGTTSEGHPQIRTRNAKSKIRVSHDETIVVGGLITNEERWSRQEIPIIRSLPIVNLLFRRDKKEIVETEVVMLMTPHIIKKPEHPETRLNDVNPEFSYRKDSNIFSDTSSHKEEGTSRYRKEETNALLEKIKKGMDRE